MYEWIEEDIENRVVILGIGNELRNDDAAGLKIVENLKKKLPERIKIINCGQVPENFSRQIIDFNPKYIIIIDIVDFNGKPGEINNINTDNIQGFSFSTHNYDLSLFIKYISFFSKAKFKIIGIQPKSIEFGTKISSEVQEAIEKLTKYLSEKFAD